MHRLPDHKQLAILRCFFEGNGIRGTARIVGVNKNTVLSLIMRAGKACGDFQREHLRGLNCPDIQVDELWSMVYSKKKPYKYRKDTGDVWTWVAICTKSKIIPAWYAGDRGSGSALRFIKILSNRVNHDTQITSDGLSAYRDAIGLYMRDSRYAMLRKRYIKPKRRLHAQDKIRFETDVIQGEVDHDKVSTSLVERHNLNMRMSLRRFTRKSTGFSKKMVNHRLCLDLYFYYYNFVRVHKTLRTTPACAAGISRELSLDSILDMINPPKKQAA